MRLKDVCTVFTDGDWIESKDQSEEGIRLVQTGNIGEGIYLEKEERAKYISEDTFERLKCTEIFPGDILVSRLPEPVGRACIVPDKSERMITAVDCTICRPDETIISKEYLCYFMRSNAYYTRLLGNVTGTTRKRISRKNLGNIELNIPTQDVQRAVVEQVDRIIKILDSRIKEISLLDDLIKARFVEMFGDPVENSKHWKEDELGNYLEVIGGYAFKSDGFTDKGIPVLRIGNINSGKFLPVNMVFWPEDSALIRYKVFPGDLVMSLTGTVGKDDYGNVCILGTDYNEYYLNQRNAKLSIREMLNKYYFSELLKFSQIKKRLTGISRGVRQANISNKDILTLRVPIPPMALQERFSAFIIQTDKSKVAVQKALDETQLLFDSLMQKYFG